MSVQTTDNVKTIVTRALDSVGDIATLPEVTVRIIEVVEDQNATSRELHAVIKHDPALSAKVLKVVNSAFYGLPGQVASVERAIILLGLSAVKNIAVAASLARMFKGSSDPDLFDAAELWKHCVAVAVAAKRIARVAGGAAAADEVFLAGLIHDLGLIVERQVFPKELGEVCRRCRAGEGRLLDLEEKIVGATHQDFGYALSAKWRFPAGLRACVGGHHTPEAVDEEHQGLAMILHCADILCCREGFGLDLPARGEEIEQGLLDALGITADQLADMRDELVSDIEEAEAVLGSVR